MYKNPWTMWINEWKINLSCVNHFECVTFTLIKWITQPVACRWTPACKILPQKEGMSCPAQSWLGNLEPVQQNASSLQGQWAEPAQSKELALPWRTEGTPVLTFCWSDSRHWPLNPPHKYWSIQKPHNLGLPDDPCWTCLRSCLEALT